MDSRGGGRFGRPQGNFHGGFRGRGFGPRFGQGEPRFRGGFRGRGNWSSFTDRGPPIGNNRQFTHNRNPGRRLSEVDLGITEYVSALDGFNGIIKSRFSDFQVNEISVSGEMAKLTDQEVPKLAVEVVKNEDEVDVELNVLDKYNLEVLPLEVWDKLSAIALSNNPSADSKVEVDATDMSKENRGKVYEAIEKAFGSCVVGATVNKNDKKTMVFSKLRPGMRVDNREKWKWPGEYLHFLVYKENLGTMEAANIIADKLSMPHIKSTFFGYSGTKDRRAKTTQWFSVRRVDPSKVAKACSRIRNVQVGNYQFKDYHLKLGYLRGNRFRIALRNVTASDESIQVSMESLRDTGFINYYGLQRFGSRADIPTYLVGQYLLQGKYQEAIDLILQPRAPYFRQLEIYRNTRNASRALMEIPPYSTSIEIKLLNGLARHAKKDLVNALEYVPHNTRLLYIHSYQSWVWNKCISERIKRFGLKPAVGDLVPTQPGINLDDYQDTLEDGGWDCDISELDEEKINEVIGEEPSNNKRGRRNHNEHTKKVINYPKMEKMELEVKELTQEDIDAGNYTIFDVTLPLPGHSVQYPSNMKDFYDKLALDNELNLNVKQRVKAYNLSGAYRKILAKPEHMTWKTVRYTNPHCDLIRSDWEELVNKSDIEDVPDGKYKALVVDITLRSATYATMALRELLKRDTSSESQASQNNYYKDGNDVAKESKDDDANNVEKTSENIDADAHITEKQITESDDDAVQDEVKVKRKIDPSENESLSDASKKIKVEQ